MTDIHSNGTILVAIDGSHNSLLAAGVAARMSRLLNAHLGLIHVLEVPTLSFWVGVEARMKDEIRARAEQQLLEISEKMRTVCDIVPEFNIVEGLPEEEIPRIADEREDDVLMVIVGREGVAMEKHAHINLRRRSGHLPGKLQDQLHMPLMVVPPDVPLSHICLAMADIHADLADDQPESES